MNHLKRETCELLYKLGCTSKNDAAFPEWKTKGTLSSIPAYTWDDICTKENAIKIWGDDRTLLTYGGNFTWHEWEASLHRLLSKKLNDEDWEADFLKELQESSEAGLPRV